MGLVSELGIQVLLPRVRPYLLCLLPASSHWTLPVMAMPARWMKRVRNSLFWIDCLSVRLLFIDQPDLPATHCLILGQPGLHLQLKDHHLTLQAWQALLWDCVFWWLWQGFWRRFTRKLPKCQGPQISLPVSSFYVGSLVFAFTFCPSHCYANLVSNSLE